MIPGLSANEIGVRMGTKLFFFYKEGKYIREYRDEAGYIIMRVFYNPVENIFYNHLLNYNPDTLLFFSGGKNPYVSWTIQDSLSEKVLDYTCKGVNINYSYNNPAKNKFEQYKHTFFFCPALPVNASWQKDMLAWNEVLAANPFIAIKFTEDIVGMYKQTFTAKNIEWKKLDNSLFVPDPKLILKKADD